MKARILGWSVLLLCLALFVPAAHAQYRAGLQGSVLDTQGEVVAGATVTLLNLDNGKANVVTSDSQGIYTISSLPPGNYSLTVEKQGFTKKVLDKFQVAAEQIQSINVTLEVGQVSQSVTVQGDSTPPIDTETGEIAGSLTSQEVQKLPSFGRDPFQLLRLAPGVFGDGAHDNGGGSSNLPGSAGPGGSSADSSIFGTENQVQIQANGQRNTANSFQVDGVGVNSLDWGGAATITPNEESVKEVRITSNSYDAEYGRNSGAQVEVVSQSGTNSYHGSAFIKLDRPGLNAYQPYNGPSGPEADQRVSNRFNQFGGSVGGAIIKNKLFAFFSYETLRNDSISTGTAWVETPQYLTEAASITGNLSAAIAAFPGEGASYSTVLPSTCSQAGFTTAANCQAVGNGLDIGSFNPALGHGVLDPTYGTVATPNGIGGGLDGIPDIQFVDTVNPNRSTQTQYNGRLDFQATAADLVTFSVYWVPNDLQFYNGQARPANLWNSDRLNYSGALLWNHTFNSSLINEARFNVSRWYFNELATNPQEPFGLPEGTINGAPGSICCITFGANGPGIFYKTGYDFRDTVTKVLNRHSLKFGIDLTKEQNTDTQAGGARPAYNFNDVWDFVNDAPVSENANFNPTTGVPTSATHYIRSNDYALFVQDDIKVKPNLTVNLGMRWEYFGPDHEKYGNLSIAELGPAADPLTGATVKIGGDLFNASKHNFGPQIGFAWSPGKFPFVDHDFNNKLVVRGGFGIGYNRMEEAITLNGRSNPSPIFANFNLVGADVIYAAPSDPHQFGPYPANPNATAVFDPATNLPIGGAPINLVGFDHNLSTPYTYRYSLETQYDLGHNLVATVGYQGSSSHHLTRLQNNLNIQYPGDVNPVIQQYTLFTNDASGNYNALLTELQKRFSKGFQVDFQYSYSRAMDDASFDYYFDQYPFNAKSGYGPSDYDATHNVKLWGLWTPKFFNAGTWKDKVIDGWTLSGIWNWHTGFPWTPTYNVQVAGDPNSCSLVVENSGYCSVRPAAYLGGAGTNYSNSTFKQQLGNFPAGPGAYFTAPVLDPNAIPAPPGVGRNSFRGPHYSSVDATLGKAFGLPNMRVLGENASIEIRANFYNLFNQLNFQAIGNQTVGNINIATDGTNTVSNNTTFGQAQNGLAGRVVEAQARFSF